MTGVRETKEQSSEDIPYIYCLYCTPLHYKMVGKGYVVQPFLSILAKPTCFRSAQAPGYGSKGKGGIHIFFVKRLRTKIVKYCKASFMFVVLLSALKSINSLIIRKI